MANNDCMADFTINGQPDNYEIPVSDPVMLLAGEAGATAYQWEVYSTPPGRGFTLQGETQAEKQRSSRKRPLPS